MENKIKEILQDYMTERQIELALPRLVNLISFNLPVMPSLPQSDTCPRCSAYDWSYHAGIEKMKCGDCGYEA